MKHKTEILRLRSEGKTYDEIAKEVGCSKGTIAYHCGKGQKEKNLKRTKEWRQDAHPYATKIYEFRQKGCVSEGSDKPYKSAIEKIIYYKIRNFHVEDKRMKKYQVPTFTVQDVINKFGKNPVCYLTGMQIDIYDPKSYEFDHKIPKSRGGDNCIDNLGICTREANRAKHSMTPEEFVELCRTVCAHNKQ